MNQHGRGRHVKFLWGLILFGIAYSSLLYSQRTITGTNLLEGIIAVLLGLYLCSHPAALMIEMFFFGVRGRRLFPSRRSLFLWLGLNLLALLVGWLSIFIGTTRIVGREG
jgi:hypothetical protein